MTDIGELPVEIVYPSITLTDVNNISIDNTTQTITGLQDDTLYNIRAVLRHNTTGVSKVIDKRPLVTPPRHPFHCRPFPSR